MAEKGSDSRRLARRERRQLEREQQKIAPILTRGRLRFPKRLVVFASAALVSAASIGGGAYFIDQGQSYAISEAEETSLIHQAIDIQEIAFDPYEAALWEQAEKDALSLPLDNLNSYQRQKLGIVNQAMLRSHNPYFKPAIDDMNNLIESQTLTVVVSPSITSITHNTSAGMAAIAQIGNGQRLDLSLHIPFLGLVEASPLEIALYFVHERTHMRQYLNLDTANIHLSGQERSKALITFNNTEDKSVQVEAEAYGEQSKAFIIAKGQTGFSNIRPEQLVTAAHFIKSGNNHNAAKFRAFIRDIMRGKPPAR